MVERGDEPPTRGLRDALEHYEQFREGLRVAAERYEQFRRDRGYSGKLVDPDDERQLYRLLYRFARALVGAEYVGDLPENLAAEAYAQEARGYLLSVAKLSEVLTPESLESLRQILLISLGTQNPKSRNQPNKRCHHDRFSLSGGTSALFPLPQAVSGVSRASRGASSSGMPWSLHH